MGFCIERILPIMVFLPEKKAKIKERKQRKKRSLENQIV